MKPLLALLCLSLVSGAFAQDEDMTAPNKSIPDGATSVFDQINPQGGYGDVSGPKNGTETESRTDLKQDIGRDGGKTHNATASDAYRQGKQGTPSSDDVVPIDPNTPSVFTKDEDGNVTGLVHKSALTIGDRAKALTLPPPTQIDLGPAKLPDLGLGTVRSLPYLSPQDLADLGDPPPMPTPQRPANPDAMRAYNDQVQTRLGQRAEQAERSGDASSAALFSAYASKPNDALRQAAQALANDPGDKKALTAMMLAHEQQGHHEEAREMARRALAADPDNQVARLMVGAEGNLDKGAALQKKFGKIDLGKTAETDGLSGGLLGLFGGRPSADDAGRRAAGAGQAGAAGAFPQTAGGGIVRPAAPVYDVTQPLTPAQQLVLRAVHKHEIGDEQGAMLALTEAIDRDPKDAGAFVVRAEVDNTLTKYAAAVLDATKAFDLAPAKPLLSARALRARAYANLELKQWVQALADASHSVDQDPRNGLGYLYRAMAEDKLGRGTAASDDLSQAVKLDPALTPLAKPLMLKYGLQQAPSKSGRRSWPVLFVFVGGASLLLAYGMRKLVAGPRMTTTAARPLRESTPVP